MNNIVKIESFISSEKDRDLLINQVNEEIFCFYDFVIRDLANKYNIRINNNKSVDYVDPLNDLFGTKELSIYNSNTTKVIQEISKKNFKKVIFTDYKNYKKLLSKFITINGYDFKKDLIFFLNNFCKINNKNLIDNCLVSPYLISSEVSKYKVNKTGYSLDHIKIDSNNSIFKIRKDIFLQKKSIVDVKKLFAIIKQEVQYKKFNFLTY